MWAMEFVVHLADSSHMQWRPSTAWPPQQTKSELEDGHKMDFRSLLTFNLVRPSWSWSGNADASANYEKTGNAYRYMDLMTRNLSS